VVVVVEVLVFVVVVVVMMVVVVVVFMVDVAVLHPPTLVVPQPSDRLSTLGTAHKISMLTPHCRLLAMLPSAVLPKAALLANSWHDL
jgi:hypothetical protein